MKNTVVALAVVSVSASLIVGCSSSASSSAQAGESGPVVMLQAALASAPAVALTKEEKAARAEWWYSLARKGSVTNDEATRGLLMHLDDSMASAEYSARVSYMKGKRLWSKGFGGAASGKATRGDLAVAFCKVLKIEGGINTALFGASPRYCTRTLVFEGFYPESTPNQGFSGAEFVGIVGASDDRRRGDPSNFPAESIPGYVEQTPAVARDGTPVLDYRKLPLILTEAETDFPLELPVYLQAAPAGDAAATKLRVFITAVQGDQAQFRKDASSAWEDAEEGIEVSNTAEFRTGDKSSIRFNIPPGQTFTLDRLGSCSIAEAVQLGNKVKTNVAVEQGRLRMDVNETAPAIKAKIEKVDANSARIAEAGVIHETSIRSPNSALAVRGTRVSLLDQPPFAPRAVSLVGRAEYMNTRKQLVSLGGAGKATVEGEQTGAAQNAAFASAPKLPTAVLAANYDLAQANRVLATGGRIRGDVIEGNAGLEAGKSFTQAPFGFVLGFGSPGSTTYQDLNLGVVTPRSTPANPDFIANGPFTGSLDPSRPGYAEYRAQNYPKTTLDGSGVISKNAVSVPENLAVDRVAGGTAFRATEFAIFDKIDRGGTGKYKILVTNFIDVPDGVVVEGKGSNPVPATLQVIVNGKTQTIQVDGQRNFGVGLYETKVIEFDTDLIPESAFSAVPNAGKKLSKSKQAAAMRAQNKAVNALIRDGVTTSTGTLAGDQAPATPAAVKGKKKTK